MNGFVSYWRNWSSFNLSSSVTQAETVFPGRLLGRFLNCAKHYSLCTSRQFILLTDTRWACCNVDGTLPVFTSRQMFLSTYASLVSCRKTDDYEENNIVQYFKSIVIGRQHFYILFVYLLIPIGFCFCIVNNFLCKTALSTAKYDVAPIVAILAATS